MFNSLGVGTKTFNLLAFFLYILPLILTINFLSKVLYYSKGFTIIVQNTIYYQLQPIILRYFLSYPRVSRNISIVIAISFLAAIKRLSILTLYLSKQIEEYLRNNFFSNRYRLYLSSLLKTLQRYLRYLSSNIEKITILSLYIQ